MDTYLNETSESPAEAGSNSNNFSPETVTFTNPFFTFSDQVTFERLNGEGCPVMVVPLSEQSISMNFKGVKKELGLCETDNDYLMLDIITKSLDYVCALRVGDPIPSEIINGEASWAILDKHKVIARQRITVQLVSWLQGTEELVTNPNQLAELAENPEIRKRIDDAFISVAEALGLERDKKDQVVSLVENLAEELAYIEALRDIMHRIQTLKPVLSDLIKKSKFEEFMRETALSVQRLVTQSLQTYSQEFLQLDAQTGEIIAALKNITAQIAYIRTVRDDLARRLLAWDPLLKKWKKADMRNRVCVDELLIETYRFLAARHLPAVNWKLVTQALDQQCEKKSETIW